MTKPGNGKKNKRRASHESHFLIAPTNVFSFFPDHPFLEFISNETRSLPFAYTALR
jgi:hypothetical protein